MAHRHSAAIQVEIADLGITCLLGAQASVDQQREERLITQTDALLLLAAHRAQQRRIEGTAVA
jgi:hypothetical protein